jgi:hypothetical protein
VAVKGEWYYPNSSQLPAFTVPLSRPTMRLSTGTTAHCVPTLDPLPQAHRLRPSPPRQRHGRPHPLSPSWNEASTTPPVPSLRRRHPRRRTRLLRLSRITSHGAVAAPRPSPSVSPSSNSSPRRCSRSSAAVNTRVFLWIRRPIKLLLGANLQKRCEIRVPSQKTLGPRAGSRLSSNVFGLA